MQIVPPPLPLGQFSFYEKYLLIFWGVGEPGAQSEQAGQRWDRAQLKGLLTPRVYLPACRQDQWDPEKRNA